MIRAVVERHAHIDHWITREIASTHGFAHAFFDRGNIVAGNRPADDLIDKLESLARRERLDLYPGIAELAAPARLFFQSALRAGAPANGLLVRHLRRLEHDLRAIFALEFLDDDLDMLLPHTRK